MKTKLVTIACNPHFWEDKIFNREFMKTFPAGEGLTDLADELLKNGYDVVTHDKYLKFYSKENSFLISEMAGGTNQNNQKLNHAVSFSLESPIIASRYYHRIKNKTIHFKKIFDWDGISERVGSEKFISMHIPNKINKVLFNRSWNERKFLTVINSNKKAWQWYWPEFNFKNTQKILRSLISNLNTTWIKNIDPIMKCETYSKRLDSILFFGGIDKIDLYGNLWDKEINNPKSNIAKNLKNIYRGKIPDNEKFSYLSQYKFSIVIENAIFPGYLTEKIFDCFFSGVIPIYLGDPQISQKLPLNTYIDLRKFSSNNELYSYLCSFSEDQFRLYLEAIKNFIESEKYYPYTTTNFAKTITNVINELRQ